jgi:hypothetical protein
MNALEKIGELAATAERKYPGSTAWLKNSRMGIMGDFRELTRIIGGNGAPTHATTTRPQPPTSPAPVSESDLAEIHAGLKRLLSDPASLTPPPQVPKLASLDAAAAVRLLATNDPDAQAQAARFYVRHPEDFLDAVQEAAKGQTPLQAQKAREQAAIASEMKRRGWK